MPGVMTVTRTVRNVSGGDLQYAASGQSPAGASISVQPGAGLRAGRAGGGPRHHDLGAGRRRRPVLRPRSTSTRSAARGGCICRSRSASAREGDPRAGMRPDLDPLAQRQLDLHGHGAATRRSRPPTWSATSTTSSKLQVRSAADATRVDAHTVSAAATLAGRVEATPSIAAGSGPARTSRSTTSASIRSRSATSRR